MVDLRLLEHLVVQLLEDRLIIQTTPAAEFTAEPSAMELAQAICQHLYCHQIFHKVLTRGQPDAPIEIVTIPLPRSG